MSRIHPECPDSDPSDRSVASHVLLRQEPAEEEGEEEDEGDGKEDDDDDDKATTATISAILKNPRDGGFVSDSLVYRYPPQPRIDGLPGEEGTFNMCSFWLVEALTRSSLALPEKVDQARLLFVRVLGYANHLGLYPEQTGQQGEALGNFPQAFTHLALISAAFNLDRMLGS